MSPSPTRMVLGRSEGWDVVLVRSSLGYCPERGRPWRLLHLSRVSRKVQIDPAGYASRTHFFS